MLRLLQLKSPFCISEEDVVFEDATSADVVAPIGTIEVKVAIVPDELVRQRPEAFSPEVRT